MIMLAREMAQGESELTGIVQWSTNQAKKLDESIEELKVKKKREEKALLKKHKKIIKYFRDVDLSDPEILEVAKKPEDANERSQHDKKIPDPYNSYGSFTFANSNGSSMVNNTYDSKPQSAAEKQV